MEIKPKRIRFHILPILSFTKHINPLSYAAKKSFNCYWDHYYTIEIGWLFWDNF